MQTEQMNCCDCLTAVKAVVVSVAVHGATLIALMIALTKTDRFSSTKTAQLISSSETNVCHFDSEFGDFMCAF